MTLVEIQRELNDMNPVDLAEKLEGLNPQELARDIILIKKELLADAFAELTPAKKLELVETLKDDKMVEIITELEADELVDTLQELPANMVNKMLAHVDPSRVAVVNKLLGYAENSVGSIMSVNYLKFKEETKVKHVIDKVLESDADGSKLELIWVTDAKLELKGFVYLADLIRTDKVYLHELYTPIAFSVHATDDQEELVDLALKYNFSDIPVVDSENRMVGIVPTEWTVEVIDDEFGEDLYNLSGITESEDENYMESSIWGIAKSRVTWLIICLITATLTSFIIQRYEATLATSVLLAAYIPMLMDSGGNAGTQASTTIIQSLSKNDLDDTPMIKIVTKEALIGLIVGSILVVVNVFRMMIFDQASVQISLTVSITLLITVIFSKVLGGLLPIIAEKIHVDPTVMSGPIITTIVDTLVLIIYFEIANMVIGF